MDKVTDEGYWQKEFEKVVNYWYSKETPNMDKNEFLLIKQRKAMRDKLQSSMVEDVAGKWELKGHSYQIADTGDYDGHWEITDGKIQLFTKDDDDESLGEIVKVLNHYDIDFYVSDEVEFENHLLKQEIKQLKCAHPSIKKVENDYSVCTDCEKPFTESEIQSLQPTSIIQGEKLYKWVRASEELPEDYEDVPLRKISTGFFFNGFYDGKVFWAKADRQIYFEKKEIEWLKEITI